MADLNNNGIEDYFEGPSYEEELNRFMLGTGGFGAPSDKVYIPSFGQPAPGIVEALPAMPSIEEASPAMQPFDFPTVPTPIADSVGQYSYVNPMMRTQSLAPVAYAPTPVTNVGLMGEPLREQPSVEDIRSTANQTGIFGQPLPPGAIENNQENMAGFQGFLSGLGRVFTDPTGSKMRAERYGVPAPAESQVRMDNPMMQPQPIMSSTPTLDSVLNYGVGPFQPGAIDFSNPPTTNVPSYNSFDNPTALEEIYAEPEATFIRADGSIGQIFPNQRIGDAFPGNPDTPVVGSPFIPELQTYQGTDLPGGDGYQRAPEGMVPTIGPDGQMIFTTPEQANLIASSMSNGVNPYFVPQESTGSYSEAPTMSQIEQFNNVQQPGSPGSRLDSMGLNMDSLRQLGRDAIAGPKAAFRYFTDPSQPSFGEVIKDVSGEQGTGSGFEIKTQPQAIPQGQQTSIQRNFVDRMATGEPLTQDETAAALEFARFNNLNFDPVTGFSPAPTVGSQQAMRSAPSAMNQQTMMTAQPRRPARSAYEQASLERQIAIGGTGSYEVDSALRQARLKAMDKRPGETQTERDTRIAKSRTQGADRGGQLSQADIRDLVKGSSSGAKVGDVARATEIRQRQALNQARNQARFQQAQPRQDKLSESTAMIDRMIKNGTLSPSKRTAAIQKLMNLGSVTGAGGSGGSGGSGGMTSTEFNRIYEDLQPGGSLHSMGIRIDPTTIDPQTGGARIYREDDGGFFGSSFETPISQELLNRLAPYARQVRQATLKEDYNSVGLKVNQFAGSK